MNKRFEDYLELLEKNRLLNVNDLSDQFNVSQATIRRDLTTLEEQGKLKRIPGGAIPINNDSIIGLENDLSNSNKLKFNSNEKKEVCQLASLDVQDGECIFIDGGTTTVHLFEILKNKKITIVTNNHLFITQVNQPTVARVIMIGGLYMTDFGMTYGPEALMQLERYNFDRCFIACVGVSLKNKYSYCTETETCAIKENAMQNSKTKYLLIDHSKIGVIGFCTLKPLREFDKIICDKKLKDIEYPDNFIFKN